MISVEAEVARREATNVIVGDNIGPAS